MSESTNNPQLDKYLERDATTWGRAINWVTDTARESVGLPGIWQQAAEHDAYEDRLRQQEQTVADRVTASGLSAVDQQAALSLIAGLEREYPQLDQQTRDNMVEHSITYLQDRAEQKVTQNQLILFTEEQLEQARPFDREAGLAKLENLGLLMRDAEEKLTDNLAIPNEDAFRPWDLVENQMEVVYHDPDAMKIATEWGIRPTEFGLPLMAPDGTALQSADLLERVRREYGHDPEAFSGDEGPVAYSEAYADVAGDATLSWRLENESPFDILADVKRQVHGHSNDNGIDR